MTTVAVDFYVVRQNEEMKEKKRNKEEFDRQRQTSHIRSRFYNVFSYYSKDTNIE